MKDATVEADGIIPPMREDNLLTSGSEDDDSEEGEAAYAKGTCVALCFDVSV